MYGYIYTCVCVYANICIRIYIWIAELLYLSNDLALTPGTQTVLQVRNSYTNSYIRTHVYVFIYIYMYVCTYLFTCVCVYRICVYEYTYG